MRVVSVGVIHLWAVTIANHLGAMSLWFGEQQSCRLLALRAGTYVSRCIVRWFDHFNGQSSMSQLRRVIVGSDISLS